MSYVVTPALARRVRALAFAAPLLCAAVAPLGAQATSKSSRASKDSARVDSARAQRL
jgi:hypothetical protein